MKRWFVGIFIVLLAGCSKYEGPTELEGLSSEVLKKGQGVQIEVTPIKKGN